MKPLTPLPWSFDRGRIDATAHQNLPALASTARAEDGRYIAHSANAYPKLVEALRTLTGLCDNVPVFQLDDGKASVKAVRLAGKFTAAHRTAAALLRELGEAS